MLLQRQRIPRNNDDFDSKKLTHSPRGGAIEKQEVKHMRDFISFRLLVKFVSKVYQ